MNFARGVLVVAVLGLTACTTPAPIVTKTIVKYREVRITPSAVTAIPAASAVPPAQAFPAPDRRTSPRTGSQAIGSTVA
jgi:hypothetical protein